MASWVSLQRLFSFIEAFQGLSTMDDFNVRMIEILLETILPTKLSLGNLTLLHRKF